MQDPLQTSQPLTYRRSAESGQTILIVALTIVTVLAMAALAIDIVTLYVAKGEMQRAADAVVLVAAKAFVDSGVTSAPNNTKPTNAGHDLGERGHSDWRSSSLVTLYRRRFTEQNLWADCRVRQVSQWEPTHLLRMQARGTWTTKFKMHTATDDTPSEHRTAPS